MDTGSFFLVCLLMIDNCFYWHWWCCCCFLFVSLFPSLIPIHRVCICVCVYPFWKFIHKYYIACDLCNRIYVYGLLTYLALIYVFFFILVVYPPFFPLINAYIRNWLRTKEKRENLRLVSINKWVASPSLQTTAKTN